MPNRDGTGPQGLGPLTGRGFGNCSNGRGNFQRGQGLRRGFGFSRGSGRNFATNPRREITLTKEEEEKVLKESSEDIKL